jgi:predicted Rossmann fold nucleotide-binding protein DprA/Smf involved in DNA uptake
MAAHEGALAAAGQAFGVCVSGLDRSIRAMPASRRACMPRVAW